MLEGRYLDAKYKIIGSFESLNMKDFLEIFVQFYSLNKISEFMPENSRSLYKI